MALVDTQGLMEQVVTRVSREPVDFLVYQDRQVMKVLVAILVYLENPDIPVPQVTLDMMVSQVIAESKVFQDILDTLVHLDSQELKVSVVTRESLVFPDTVELMVRVDTQEERE